MIEDIINNEIISFESIHAVSHSIESILENGARYFYRKYILEKMPAYLTQDQLSKQFGLIELYHLQYDQGESSFNYMDQWTEDVQPENIPIDNCASLSIKKETKYITNVPNYGINAENNSKTYSVSAYSSKSLTSKLTSFVKTASAASKLKSENKQEKDKRFKQIDEFQTKPIDSEEIIQTDAEIRQQKIEDRLRADRERKAKQKQDEADKRKRKEEEEEEQKAQLKKTQQNLKNRLYTYDYKGGLIICHQLKTDGFPDQIQTLDFNSRNPLKVVKKPFEQFNLHDLDNPFDEIKNLQTSQIQIKEQLKENLKIKSDREREKLKEKLQELEDLKQKEEILLKKIPKFGKNTQDCQDMIENIFLQPSPALFEILNAADGTEITFENGVKKQGEPFQSQNRMNKQDYKKISQEKPRAANYLKPRGIEIEEDKGVEIVIQNQFEQEQDKKMEPLRGGHEINLNKKEQNIKVKEQDLLIKMLADTSDEIQQKKKLDDSINQENIPEFKQSEALQPQKKFIKVLDRIECFRKIGDMNDMVKNQKQGELQPSKIHQIIQDFNENEILQNPQWGYDISKSNQNIEYNGQILKERVQSAVSYKQQRQLLNQTQKQLTTKSRIRSPLAYSVIAQKNQYNQENITPNLNNKKKKK